MISCLANHLHFPYHKPHRAAAAKTVVDAQNGVFFTVFFTIAYYLITPWRQKIRNSTPIHVLTMLEMAAIITFVACCILLLVYLGTHFLDDEEEETSNSDAKYNLVFKQVVKQEETMTKEDEALIQAVVAGKIPSYSLETKLGDCKHAAFIRQVALERITRKSLDGLPLEGFDYESILGQCCEMPVGYVLIPVGIAGPMLLDGKELYVPMATTEGCLVASTNRGCKAISVSGGATSVLLKDGMTRALVVRFGPQRELLS
ncbi:putative hydroxymethylglutaryl-CoA reductase (NADPH) [Helianthus debilis subsp. tardiflorus]